MAVTWLGLQVFDLHCRDTGKCGTASLRDCPGSGTQEGDHFHGLSSTACAVRCWFAVAGLNRVG